MYYNIFLGHILEEFLFYNYSVDKRIRYIDKSYLVVP